MNGDAHTDGDAGPPRVAMSGMGDTQRRILALLKREGDQSVGELAGILGLAAETVRGHLNSLAAEGLARRSGRRKKGPGRPEILYGLTGRAEDLFPHEEGRLLRDLTEFLTDRGHRDVLESFFEARVADQREDARGRLEGLTGRERLDEVAALLTEEGFMAEVVEDEEGEPRLRLCHCPLKEMVAVSRLPCRAEIGFIEELLGQSLQRTEYMPEGDHSCSYRATSGDA